MVSAIGLNFWMYTVMMSSILGIFFSVVQYILVIPLKISTRVVKAFFESSCPNFGFLPQVLGRGMDTIVDLL